MKKEEHKDITWNQQKEPFVIKEENKQDIPNGSEQENLNNPFTGALYESLQKVKEEQLELSLNMSNEFNLVEEL